MYVPSRTTTRYVRWLPRDHAAVSVPLEKTMFEIDVCHVLLLDASRGDTADVSCSLPAGSMRCTDATVVDISHISAATDGPRSSTWACETALEETSTGSDRSAGSDVWELVLRALAPKDAGSVMAVCRRWRDRSCNARVWRSHVQRHFPEELRNVGQPWHVLYWRAAAKRAKTVISPTVDAVHNNAHADEMCKGARRRGVSAMLFLATVLIAIALIKTSSATASTDLAPFVIVRGDSFGRSSTHGPADFMVAFKHLAHIGEIKALSNVSGVHGTLIRAHHATERFHIFGSHEGSQCKVPLPTHVIAQEHRCALAVNGGAFDVAHDEPCDQGFFVSNNTVVGKGENSPEFAVTQDGRWVVGTISLADVRSLGIRDSVNGLGWLVRDGVNMADSGGSVRAHTAIGVNEEGVLLILQVDGCAESGVGQTSDGMARLLIENGAIHAIDLDGGSSSTVFANNTIINHPTGTGHWMPAVERHVESIVCLQ